MKYFIDISKQDWLVVFIFGIIFGGVLGSFITILISAGSIYRGFFTGIIFGSFIFLYSYLFINFSNKYVLKHFPEGLWEFISLFFSFLSGFFGSITGYLIVKNFGIILVKIDKEILFLSFVSIGILTAVLGYLLYWIVNIRKIKSDLEKSLITARLKSLEYQINPHFLFNTLNVLAELTHIDPPLAEKTIITFSKYLRDIIDEESLIEVEKELSIVQKYIFIQKIRFPQINVEYHIDQSIYKVKIPKLSLQILVENAIKHGVKSKGNVWIKGYKKDSMVILEVVDDGEGFSQIVEGTGLKNLKTRLKLLVNGYLEYFRENNKTVFRITLPINF
ncbi:histidine kinase [Sulfurihydrogenibium sp.]|uniref:sensor histidine kinase n=1 Tax=Sulfurihydrogenibium sp. TaxID=2053621 RepID=UPI00262AA9C7|nr:histidine kinase [Sulfurihydrogenibium sp.]